VERATEASDNARLLAAFVALGELYENDLMWIEKAIDAYEAAQTLDSRDTARAEKLAELYASDPARYLGEGRRLPDRAAPPESSPGGALQAPPCDCTRKPSTQTRHGASVRRSTSQPGSEPDEEPSLPAHAERNRRARARALTDETWLRYQCTRTLIAFLTRSFALIEPAVIGSRSRSARRLGYDPR
jgi:hypothetical protein